MEEISRLVDEFTNATLFRPVAWKAVCVACHLLLQRPHDSKIMMNNSEHLLRRLSWWKSQRIPELLAEGECLQNRLPSVAHSSKVNEGEKSDITFSNS